MQLSAGRRTLWAEGRAGSATAARYEAPYLAVLAAIRSTSQLPHAVAALQQMAAADVPPTLRTRLAICRMALRLQEQPGADGQRQLPGSSRFWSELSPQPSKLAAGAAARADEASAPSLAALIAAGVGVSEAADLVLEVRAAAILDRVAELIRASGDGRALSALISRDLVRTRG